MAGNIPPSSSGASARGCNCPADTRAGVYAPDATILGCSFYEVQDRINRRGHHVAPFATEADGGKIADAFGDAIHAPDTEDEYFFGISQPVMHDLIYSNHLMWAPDGDEAFDDGSYILHFDVGYRVRLIGFKKLENEYHYDLLTLSDVWLETAEFYNVLQRWRNTFEAEWLAALEQK